MSFSGPVVPRSVYDIMSHNWRLSSPSGCTEVSGIMAERAVSLARVTGWAVPWLGIIFWSAERTLWNIRVAVNSASCPFPPPYFYTVALHVQGKQSIYPGHLHLLKYFSQLPTITFNSSQRHFKSWLSSARHIYQSTFLFPCAQYHVNTFRCHL